jgi:hypothetical protein
MQRAFAHACQRNEAQRHVKAHGVRFRVRDHTYTTETLALIECEPEDVSQERFAKSEPLGANIDGQAGKPEYGQRVTGQTLPKANAGQVCAFDGANRDRGEPDDMSGDDRHVSYRDVKLELVLPGIVLEESI